MIQGSKEWHEARLGHITGSIFGKMEKKTAKFSQTAISQMIAVLAERLTGQHKEFSTNATQWGNDHENEAKALYEERKQCIVQDTGFVKKEGFKWAGCSPDGFIDFGTGIVEIKCPYNTENHLKYCMANKVPKDYLAQVNFNLWVTGAEYCDFISFDPRLPENLQLHIVRHFNTEENKKYCLDQYNMILAEIEKIETEIRKNIAV